MAIVANCACCGAPLKKPLLVEGTPIGRDCYAVVKQAIRTIILGYSTERYPIRAVNIAAAILDSRRAARAARAQARSLRSEATHRP